MRRREFLTLAGGAALSTSPLVSRAQQMRVIGVLVAGAPPPAPYLKEIRAGLESLGYSEGRNVRLEVRNAEGLASRLPELAAQLVNLKVDVILAFQTPAALAARRATGEIPIVMAPAGDPVATGLVASLARPGGNVTGISAAAAEIAGKTVQLFRELVPSARRVAVLLNSADPFHKPLLAQIESDARTLGMEVETFAVRPSDPMEPVIAAIAGRKPDALMIQGSLSRKDIVDLAIKYRLAAISHNLLVAKVGGLMAYAANQEEMYRRATAYVDRILKGAKPSELPVEQPTKYQLVINARTAKALGIEISPTWFARAEEVIE